MKLKSAFFAFCFLLSHQVFSQFEQVVSFNYHAGNTVFEQPLKSIFTVSEGFLISLQYHHQLNTRFFFVTGVKYNHYEQYLSENHPSLPNDLRGQGRLFSVPLLIQYNLSPFLFFQTGVSVDADFGSIPLVNKQSGIGFELGPGFRLPLNKVEVYFNPYFNVHSMIPFKSHEIKERLIDVGFKIGIGYRFGLLDYENIPGGGLLRFVRQ